MNAIKILKALSQNLILSRRLTELALHMPCDVGSLQKIKSFQNLEVLTMELYCTGIPPAVFRGFPPKLRNIKIDGIEIPCSVFLSLVQKLKFLEVFDIGRGDIVLNSDTCR